MLNRLYIVIGVLAILVLAAAFIVPRLVPWGNYRDRMEVLAARALGGDVRIKGDIKFALLPQPHLSLSDVSVGPVADPAMAVKSVDADFSLIDFLRDRYTMTKLTLDHPVLDVKIGDGGEVETGLKLNGADSKANLSVANARISVGTIRVTDARSGANYALEGIDGDLTLSALNGPFGFIGGGTVRDQHYNFHVNTQALDAKGNTQMSLFAKPDSGAFSINLDGALATGAVPHFAGDLTYRQSPAGAKDPNNLVGDLTLTGKVDATPDKLALADYTLIPDENRAVTRLTGTASIELSHKPTFTAVVTGGVLALPPRDATTEQGPQPYELVRLLGELPAPPLPPLAGGIAINIDELNLRSFSIRNIRIAATTDGKAWSVKQFAGDLPGDTKLVVAGDLSAPGGRPSFSGTLSLATDRLDALATLWRKPADNNPLFNMPGAFTSKLVLLGQTMALTDGQLTLDTTTHSLTALINFGAKRRLDVSGQFTDLNADDGAALLALVPEFETDQSAALTFPEGAVAFAANTATVVGLEGHELALEGKWGGGSLELSKVSAKDLGGAAFDLSLALSGTFAEPKIAGDGDLKLAAGGGPALDLLFDTLNTPKPMRQFLARSLPLDLKTHLDAPKDDSGQGLALSGKAGVASLTLDARLDGGLLKALTSPIGANLELSSADVAGLTGQLGLGDVSLMPETAPLKVALSLEGVPTDSLKTSASISGGGDSIGFEGNIKPGDLSTPSGSGTLKLALSDTSVLAADLGIAGLYTPPIVGGADLRFDGRGGVNLDNIKGTSGTVGFSGKLAMNRDAGGGAVTGSLTLDSMDVAGLVALASGPTALIASAGKTWPDGPLSVGDVPRTTTGNVAIETPAIALGDKPFATDAGFNLTWDATSIWLHSLEAKLGSGRLGFDVAVCCAGAATDKQISGQASVNGVALADLLPSAASATLSGTLDGSAQFSGTGDSIDAVMGGLSGDGSFSIAGLKVQKFDPHAFAAVAGIADIINLDPNILGTRVAAALDQGAFETPKIGGSFTIAGGTARVPNVAAATPAAKLFGSATIKLADLGLGGSFALTPIGTLDAAGLVSETTSKITANLSGTLTAPKRTLDIGTMVDAIKVKAYEVEVARLEALKAEDDARAKVAAIATKGRAQAAASATKEAAEDASLQQLADAIEAKRVADAAAAKKAADAAAKKAADAAAAKKAADAQAAQQQIPPPMDLNIPSTQFFQPLN